MPPAVTPTAKPVTTTAIGPSEAGLNAASAFCACRVHSLGHRTGGSIGTRYRRSERCSERAVLGAFRAGAPTPICAKLAARGSWAAAQYAGNVRLLAWRQ